MKKNPGLSQRVSMVIFILFLTIATSGQKNPVYEHLPVGKYAVGFKIVTITDASRVTKPEYNYLGEKNPGDRSKKITIHLWYPATDNSGEHNVTYGEYCYNNLFTTTDEAITSARKASEFDSRRRSVEGWFGKTTDDAWKKLIETSMLAHTEAARIKGKFPLLIGTLRSLSTSVTNEVLASNGYVVAMINSEGAETFSQAALQDIPDIQFVINYLDKNEGIDISNIGAFGFSGSGFSQVLFAMYDYRVKALADLESGIYMDGLFQGFSSSNYYNPSKLRVPFLHVFSRDLSKQEKYIDEFENKAKFSKRYRLLLNQPALHHWDFAAEGYTSCIVLKNRGAAQDNIQKSFEIASIYLLNFFNAELKGDSLAEVFLERKPTLTQILPALWDVRMLNPLKPAPNKDEFENIIRTKGIRAALAIVNNTLVNDSSSGLTQGFILNRLGYTFLNEQKFEEAIGVFKLNTEIHPGEANFFDSLAEGYEVSGDKENMKKVSGVVIDILGKKTTLTGGDRSLKESAEKRLEQ